MIALWNSANIWEWWHKILICLSSYLSFTGDIGFCVAGIWNRTLNIIGSSWKKYQMFTLVWLLPSECRGRQNLWIESVIVMQDILKRQASIITRDVITIPRPMLCKYSTSSIFKSGICHCVPQIIKPFSWTGKNICAFASAWMVHIAESFLRSRQSFRYWRISNIYGIRKFITVFTRALHWSLSWARPIQSIPLPSYTCKFHFNIILPPI
jgi:hypothetical protein